MQNPYITDLRAGVSSQLHEYKTQAQQISKEPLGIQMFRVPKDSYETYTTKTLDLETTKQT